MAAEQEIAEFQDFAKRLEQERGEAVTVDEAYQLWSEVDPNEVTILKERMESYEAGERGRPVDEFLAERRAARAKNPA